MVPTQVSIKNPPCGASVKKLLPNPLFLAFTVFALSSCGSGSSGGGNGGSTVEPIVNEPIVNVETGSDVGVQNPVAETPVEVIETPTITETPTEVTETSTESEGESSMPVVETDEPMETEVDQDPTEPVVENEPSDSDNDTTAQEQQFIGTGESISGRLNNAEEFITYRVPADSQVLLRSDTGDSDLFLYETLEFTNDAFVCADTSAFKEDICSGDGTGDILYATVVTRGDPSDYTLSVTNDCSVGNINQWVYRSMQDYYLFADQVPVVNPLDYDSPSALIQDLRFNELEPFSGIGDAAARQAIFEEGITFGFGYIWDRDDAGNLRVLNVDTESPFGRAGVKRGDIFHSLGGITDELLTNTEFFDLIGTQDNPKIAEWGFIDGITGELKTFMIAQAEYTVNTVAFTDVYSNPTFDGLTGYIVFNRFLNTSVEELDRTIFNLRQRNITELVLDLRYNGGGRVFVAERLAAQLSGSRLTEQVQSRMRYNDTYRSLDVERQFEDAFPSLDLSRVIVITSAATASASEFVINTLRPYMEVVTIGERTVGKPFQSRARNFCGMSLSAMNSEIVNASEASVAGGIGAACFAADDRTRDYGIGDGGTEGMLSAALDYVEFGTCEAPPSVTTIAARNSPKTMQKEWEKTGNIDLLGAVEVNEPRPFVPR